jgi:hypothetical protein
MSKTFGAKKKGNVEGVNDQYLVKDLVHLLGFEDIDEAKEACRHYNICVKEMSFGDGSNNQIDLIFWRYGTGFKEPKDPEKGTVLPLKPRKMNRIIETKLGGANRIAICRGEVSGVGATLDSSLSQENAKFLEEQAKKRKRNKLKRMQAIEKAKRHEAARLESLRKEEEAKLKEQKLRLDRQQKSQRKAEGRLRS